MCSKLTVQILLGFSSDKMGKILLSLGKALLRLLNSLKEWLCETSFHTHWSSCKVFFII